MNLVQLLFQLIRLFYSLEHSGKFLEVTDLVMFCEDVIERIDANKEKRKI